MYIQSSVVAQAAFAINIVLQVQFCNANPLGPVLARPGPMPALHAISEPVCTPVETLSNSSTSSPHILQTFPRECIDTGHHFFNFPSPMVARLQWHWKRYDEQHPHPPPGYNFLPYVAAPTMCMLKLDVLDDPNAEDQFALVQIEAEFRALFTKCVRGRVHGVSTGYIAVGPRKVLKLSIGPTPMGGLHNLTDGGLGLSATVKKNFNDLL